MQKTQILVASPRRADDWSLADAGTQVPQVVTLAAVSQLMKTSPNVGQLAKRHVEYRQGDQSIVITDEYHAPRERSSPVVYVVENDTTDKMTIFCYGFAASAFVLVAMLVVLTLLRCT